ncbi:MAG: methylated-DNA--[protein]-cysteine S-methyltransferase [Phycisphaerae bacterium]
MANKKAKYYDAWGTAWGPIGAVADDAGILSVQLPFYEMRDLLDLLAWENQSAARNPAPFARFAELSQAFFNAKPVDFSEVQVNLPGPGAFFGKVYRACQQIPMGQTRSYGELAKELGNPDAARAVATALSKNPTPLVVPCHRVIYSNGGMGGFNAKAGTDLKKRMIAHEKRLAAK